MLFLLLFYFFILTWAKKITLLNFISKLKERTKTQILYGVYWFLLATVYLRNFPLLLFFQVDFELLHFSYIILLFWMVCAIVVYHKMFVCFGNLCSNMFYILYCYKIHLQHKYSNLQKFREELYIFFNSTDSIISLAYRLLLFA